MSKNRGRCPGKHYQTAIFAQQQGGGFAEEAGGFAGEAGGFAEEAGERSSGKRRVSPMAAALEIELVQRI
jgi:hypothetical protein